MAFRGCTPPKADAVPADAGDAIASPLGPHLPQPVSHMCLMMALKGGPNPHCIAGNYALEQDASAMQEP